MIFLPTKLSPRGPSLSLPHLTNQRFEGRKYFNTHKAKIPQLHQCTPFLCE